MCVYKFDAGRDIIYYPYLLSLLLRQNPKKKALSRDQHMRDIRKVERKEEKRSATTTPEEDEKKKERALLLPIVVDIVVGRRVRRERGGRGVSLSQELFAYFLLRFCFTFLSLSLPGKKF